MRFSTSEDADTRASEENVSFKMRIGLDKEMYAQISENYVLKADDFAIRVNGDYVTFNESNVSDNSATYGTLSISRSTNSSDFTLTVEATGLGTDLNTNQAPTHVDNIAFEAYIWIQNKEALTDGSGSYGERFDYDLKLQWIDKTEPITYETERGVDITDNCFVTTQKDGTEYGLIGNTSGYGYAVRYNAYRGISGRPVNADGEFDTNTGIGDTPYIKVSIAVDQVGEDERSSVTPVYPTPNTD